MKGSWTTLAIGLMVWLGSCSEPVTSLPREGKGGRYYGGIFNANESEPLRSLFPLTLTQASAHRIAAQIYEGLVALDQDDLSIRPGLAESWTVDATGTQYTFAIRRGVRFHDDPCFPNGRGRELTAEDVAYCLTASATPGELNQMDWLLRDHVVGVNAHFAAVATGRPSPGVEGIKVLDDHTLLVTLASPWAGFLQVLAHQGCWVYPPELVKHHVDQVRWHPVGTGPFRVRDFTPGALLVLERHPAYWGTDDLGNRLPFLDGAKYTFVADKEQEIEAFLDGRLTTVFEMPMGRTGFLDSARTLGFVVQTVPGLSVQFYGFNVRHPLFRDARVREAFSLAIDRRSLVDSILFGFGVPAEHGVVPPGFEGYPYDMVPELSFDTVRARELLAEAGFPAGKGAPTVHLQVNNDGFGYVRVAEALQTMLWHHLGVQVVTSVLPVDQHFTSIETGRADFWREGWILDHPDPENVLALFQGGLVPLDTAAPSYLNTTRYRSPVFDSLFHLAQRSTGHEHLRLLAKAEAQLMSEAQVLPLYHERGIRLLQPWVRDLPINGMEYRDLRAVWFDPVVRSGR